MKTTPDYRKNHVQKWKQSGLSMQKYCRDQEISYWSFREWRAKFESENSANKNRLMQISSPLNIKSKANEPLEIILNNGIRIIIQEISGMDHFKEIVCALAGLS